MARILLLSSSLHLLIFASPSWAGDRVDYATRVKPLLQSRCYACHGVLKQKAGLRLDTATLAKKGGEGGAAIVPGDPESSPIVERISSHEESDRMPPEGEPLKPAEIQSIRDWIAGGAIAPSEELPETDPRDHWAFKTPARPGLPTVADASWSRNPIDRFIAAEHRQRGLTPVPLADRRVWLRRVTIDLIGLPPTPRELAAFLEDRSPEAFDKVVSRLLESPQYGERWGRHWMDIWRYSDWWGLGAEVRNSQKHIWHWRDWIIESVNADKGYDQMLREMLAADELYPNDLDRLRASGFLARQYFKFNRTSWLDETVEHTSKAMLGLTFNCAKCHDHKYDPFTQVNYYQFRALFEPYQVRTDAVPGELDFEKDGIPRAFDCNLDAVTYLHIRGDDRNPDKSRPIVPGFPAFLTSGPTKIVPVNLPRDAAEPGLRSFVLDTYMMEADRKVAASLAALAKAKREAASLIKVSEKVVSVATAHREAIKARALADRTKLGPHAIEAARAERALAVALAEEAVSRSELGLVGVTPEKKSKGEMGLAQAKASLEAAKKALDGVGANYTPIPGALKTLESNLETEESRRKPFPTTSTGRRTALAQWITDPKHPLTARVAVNHVWSRHFGTPLVPTVFDFGRKGTPPTHPALLDWLAVEFVEHGWSMKHLHRLIVTSNTYRLSSSTLDASSETRKADPDNRYYWRRQPVRMEAQIVRDSLLQMAGDLDLTRGGPSIPVENETSRRRSLYFVHSHNEHQKFLSMFDDAGVLECYRRAESVVPQQALALENSPLVIATAEKIARRIAADSRPSSEIDFVRAAFVTILGVEPTDAETIAGLEGLIRLTEAAARAGRTDPRDRARVGLVRALLNHNDFVTVR